MTDILTDAQIAAIAARAVAATPGPWTWEDWGDPKDEPELTTLVAPPETYELRYPPPWPGYKRMFPDLGLCILHDEDNEASDDDKAFIAAARTDIPALLASHAALAAEVERLRAALTAAGSAAALAQSPSS